MMPPRMHAFAVLLLATVGCGCAVAMESPAAPEGTSSNFMVRMPAPVAEPFASSIYALPTRAPTRPAGGPDSAAKARLDRYHSILSEKLRAVPGLALITGDTPGAPDAPYQVAIRLGADWRGVSIEATSSSSPGRVLWTSIDTQQEGALTPRLTALYDVPVGNPDQDMEGLVERLRLELFPPDRVFLDGKMSEFLDAKLETSQRRHALFQLLVADRRSALPARLSRTYRPDPALISTVANVAMTASDPALRLHIWSTLGGSGIPQIDPAVLIDPARGALARETELRVQLALLNILAMNAADPRARVTIDAIAYSEPEGGRPELVRMAARRVLGDSSGWSEYFVSRLSDPKASDVERLDLISYAYSMSTGRVRLGDAALRLDEASERSLAGLVTGQGPTQVALAAASLLHLAGGAITRAEFANFLRAGSGPSAAVDSVRRSVLSALALSLRWHPEIRPLFEEVKARDRDPFMREAASQALDQTL